MQEYYFLFALALVWTLFATIQDIRKREVANWLNFSLITFALAYRAFFSITTKDYDFFLLGLLGFIIFFALANIFYYTKSFAGGDAKLLMGYGVILPYQNLFSLAALTISFIFLLFFVGAIYSIFYSFFIIAKNKNKFSKEFKLKIKKYKNITLILTILPVILLFLVLQLANYPIIVAILIIAIIFPWLLIYTKSLDKCMIVLVSPNKLTEGDWLEKDVHIGKTTIKKSVHGLSFKEIQLLKKHNLSVLIKQGIPFVPAFLIALIVIIILFLKFQDFSFFLVNFLG